MSGDELIFTSIKIGKGNVASEDIQSLNDLVDSVITVPISRIHIDDESAEIVGSFNNSEITEGFLFKEIGLFAKDPDGGSDILYCYQNAYDTAEYIASSKSEIIEKQLSIICITGNAEHVTAKIDFSLLYMTYPDWDSHAAEEISPAFYTIFTHVPDDQTTTD
jgi:hypothetical protein